MLKTYQVKRYTNLIGQGILLISHYWLPYALILHTSWNLTH